MNQARTSTGVRLAAAIGLPALLVIVACVQTMPDSLHEWWSGHGPVISHANFPAKCSLCHTTQSWQDLREDFHFDHEAETGVTLAGAHAEAQCLRCHNDRGPVAQFSQRGCVGCHEDVHQGRLGAECLHCHDEQSWRAQGQIAEHASTRFPLFAAHAAVQCEACHTGIGSGIIEPLSPECISCHSAELARATSPDHLAQGWVDNCQDCHRPTVWGGAGFRHVGFPLTGAHATANCEACHVGGVFAGTPQDCADCHLDAYQATTDPDHVALNFPLRCDDCHSTSAWIPANFSHAGISDGCVDCHLPDYQSTTDPDHVAQNFPLDCESCHNTKSWFGGGFNHAGITDGCVDCHLADYQGANDPDHVGLGFPTECQICHNTNTWDGADFDHDFPITSGAHRGFDCADCHLTPGSASFSCTHCHEHRQSRMADKHDEVGGYVWSTPACYSCHPDGREED